MTRKDWTEKVHVWKQSVEELHRKAQFAEKQQGEATRESITELRQALEELQVAEEELREQNAPAERDRNDSRSDHFCSPSCHGITRGLLLAGFRQLS